MTHYSSEQHPTERTMANFSGDQNQTGRVTSHHSGEQLNKSPHLSGPQHMPPSAQPAQQQQTSVSPRRTGEHPNMPQHNQPWDQQSHTAGQQQLPFGGAQSSYPLGNQNPPTGGQLSYQQGLPMGHQTNNPNDYNQGTFNSQNQTMDQLSIQDNDFHQRIAIEKQQIIGSTS